MKPGNNEVKKSILTKLKLFTKRSARVFKITKKPGMAEYKVIVKVTGIGILIIGALGFLIHLITKIIS
ncbi:protein translocase SEC61 complex subunit gamma [archaeon]|jgi:protein transport protein SEC61 subunit gamma and related proteins|nr:protein translocase SEC61 complex subunit gamma [archaeon]